mmetsp:Transcript_9359/g.28365  ORF Transcript_9359/g.28365 Transcript_9359/m.28365 type:complete len:433 (+) Transcript_9359:3070-4368(+)
MLLVLLVLLVIVLGDLGGRLGLLLLALVDRLLHEHLLVAAKVGGAKAVDLIRDEALPGCEELELHFLEPRVLRQLLVADQLVGLDLDKQYHPLLVALKREVRRVDGDRVAKRLGGKAELARLRIASLLPFALALLPLKICVAPLVHQLLLLSIVLLAVLLEVRQLLVEEALIGLVVLLVRVHPIGVLREVLALHLDGQVEHVALLDVLLVLDARIVSDLNVGEVGEEQVDVVVLLLGQLGQVLAASRRAHLAQPVDARTSCLGVLRAEEAHAILDLRHVEMGQLEQRVGVEPQRLREELRELDDVDGGGHEALLHANVEKAVEQPVCRGEHVLHVGLQRRRDGLAKEEGVEQRLHLHDVVVDVSLVLNKVLGDALVQAREVVRLRVLARHPFAKLDGRGKDPRHELGGRVLRDLAVEAVRGVLHDAILEELG